MALMKGSSSWPGRPHPEKAEENQNSMENPWSNKGEIGIQPTKSRGRPGATRGASKEHIKFDDLSSDLNPVSIHEVSG